MNEFNLEEYLNKNVENIVKEVMRATISRPKASLFMAQHYIDSGKAKKLRQKAEQENFHIPPFLIASISNKCNLHCKGCFARANNSCVDSKNSNALSCEDWNSIFNQAQELGIEFILLAGGEPFVRRDVLTAAGNNRKILFPIFTNGTMIDEQYIELLDNNRNLIPMFSIEGNEQTTDTRRGFGVYKKLHSTMQQLDKKGILFGASVTVTKNNMDEVLSNEFLGNLKSVGAKAVIFIEYVPVDSNSISLALDDDDRLIMDQKLQVLRTSSLDMMLISFPGDEKASGGCLAAGRGFFHINANGGAEPCPFSPYSDTNLKNTTLKEALNSPLFLKLQNNKNLTEEHIGGCALFEQEEKVKSLLNEVTQ